MPGRPGQLAFRHAVHDRFANRIGRTSQLRNARAAAGSLQAEVGDDASPWTWQSIRPHECMRMAHGSG